MTINIKLLLQMNSVITMAFWQKIFTINDGNYWIKNFFSSAFIIITALQSCTAQSNQVLLSSEFEKAIVQMDSVQVLDVRTNQEYNTGHIKGALLANWNDPAEFNRRVQFIDKDKPLYVYCLAGGRSAAAANSLRQAGYTKVFELKGGINAWKANNKPLEAATNTEEIGLFKFEQLIKSAPTVLVDFGAVWCPPCKQMEPVLQKLSTKYTNQFTLLKVDGGKETSILAAYKVTALPVFIIFKNGVQTWRHDGVVDEVELVKQLFN